MVMKLHLGTKESREGKGVFLISMVVGANAEPSTLTIPMGNRCEMDFGSTIMHYARKLGLRELEFCPYTKEGAIPFSNEEIGRFENEYLEYVFSNTPQFMK